MAWKRKEKDLTEDQVVAMAKQELAPHWYNTAFPLLAGLEEEGTLSVHPLDPHFRDSAWVVIALDPFSNEGLLAIHLAMEWARRYETHGVKTLLAFPDLSDVFSDRRGVETFIDSQQIPMPVFVDQGGLVSRGLGGQTLPSLMFLTHEGVQFVRSGPQWFESIESEIQTYLRKKDPGLSLSMILNPEDPPRDQHRCDFGQGERVLKPHIVSKTPIPLEIGLNGEWKHEPFYIVTHDPKAELTFDMTSAGFSLMARSMSKVLERARVVIEFNGAPLYDIFGWEDLSYDDHGRSMVEIRDARLYRVGKGFKEPGKISLRFPNAESLPIALYSLFFS